MVLDGTRGFVIATVESPSALRVIMRVGEHRYLHAIAGGAGPPALLSTPEPRRP